MVINFWDAEKLVWTKAKEEKKNCRLRSPAALRKREEDAEEETFVCVLDYFLGERSSTMKLIMDASNTTCSEVLIFLARTTSKTFGLSAT